MAAPYAGPSLGNVNGLGFSCTRRLCELFDGTQIMAADNAAATASLYHITNVGQVPIFGSALSTSFTLTSSTAVVADIFVVNGASSSDIWIAYMSDGGASGTVGCAHCTYDGNNFTFDNTGTTAVTATAPNTQVGSVCWNGTNVIIVYRDTVVTPLVRCVWTATKSGASGWSSAFTLGTAGATSSQTHFFPMLRHSAKLAGGSAGATALIYCLDAGTGSSHSEQLSVLILLDSATSAASANWKAEVKNTSVTGQNMGSALLDAVIDPADGDGFVVYSSSTAGTGGASGHSCIKFTVDSSGVATWGSRALIDGSAAAGGTINIQVDGASKLFCLAANGTVGTSGTIKELTSTDDGATWSSSANTTANTTGDGYPHISHTDDLALHGIVPWIFQRGTSTFTVEMDNNSITCNLPTQPVGMQVSTFTQEDISGGPPGQGSTATLVSFVDSNGNGFGVVYNENYGGAIVSGFRQIDSGYSSMDQISHSTSNADGFEHWLFQSTGAVFSGSEDATFTATERNPTGQTFRRSYDSGNITPSSGPAVTFDVTETYYPGPVAFIFTKMVATGSVTLASSDSSEIAMIGGLTTVNQGTSVAAWQAANGKYASVGGTENAWPSSLTAANPDYAYCAPASATGLVLTPGCVKRSSNGLPDVFGSNAQVQDLSNTSRLKFKVQVDGTSFSGATVYYLQYLGRNLGSTDPNSIAADYQNPDAGSIVSTGTAASPFFDYTEGWYALTASSSQIQLTHTMTGSVDKRWLPAYKISSWNTSSIVTATLNGVALVSGTDYLSYIDTTNHILYFKFLKTIVASSAGAGQLNNGALILQGSAVTTSAKMEPMGIIRAW